MTILLTLLFIILMIAILFLFWSIVTKREAKNLRKKSSIPEGRIVYTDLDIERRQQQKSLLKKSGIVHTDLDKPDKPLFSEQYGLTGKPDYIVNKDGIWIPIEVKSSKTAIPYENDILQLAAYCLLVEKEYETTVPYGAIEYEDGIQHKIHFDDNLKSDLISTIEEMENVLRREL